MKGRFRATPEKSQDPEEPGPRTPALNLNRISGPHENVDGALHCLYACAWHMCTCESLHGAMCTVYTAAQTQVCVCDCMCTIVCLKVFELCCMCRRGLTRIVRAMCVSVHAYTAAHVYVCVCMCACVPAHGNIDGVSICACVCMAFSMACACVTTVVQKHARINARMRICASRACPNDVAVTAS